MKPPIVQAFVKARPYGSPVSLRRRWNFSNAWAVVRTMPDLNTVMDLMVSGKILQSNGEKLVLHLSVVDATGRVWIDKEYEQRASSYSYNPEVS